MKQYILFDLDGTLTDPKEGITTCVQYALKSFGIDEPDLDKLEPFIGPPLKDSFKKFYSMSDEDAEKAVEKYRERFNDTGIFENELYGGIHDLLRNLQAGGMHLAVASSKPTVYVERILKHFKIDKYFEVVVGSELDGTRVDKPQIIQEVLHRFFPNHKVRYDEIYMVGDREYDIMGARTFRIESVGVTYGYGSMEELKEAKADYIVRSVAELKQLLMREVEEIRRKQQESGAVPGAGKPAKTPSNKILWRMVLAFAAFYVMKFAATSVISMGIQMLSMQMPILEPILFVTDEAGQVAAFNGNVSLILEAFGYAAGVFAIRKWAIGAIQKTAEETKLFHLKKEPAKNYVLFAVTVLGAVFGVNILLELSGMTQISEGYKTAVDVQYAPSVLVGLIVYGFVAPVAEELLFRGVMYNCMRRFMKLNMAMLLSALLFSSFHGNSAQTMYIAVIGFIMAYAYEYFANFYVPLAIHVVTNILVYLVNNTAINESIIVSWPVCVIGLIAMVAGFILLEKEKGLLKNPAAAK